jgi:hypothetical protein
VSNVAKNWPPGTGPGEAGGGAGAGRVVDGAVGWVVVVDEVLEVDNDELLVVVVDELLVVVVDCGVVVVVVVDELVVGGRVVVVGGVAGTDVVDGGAPFVTMTVAALSFQ